MDAGARLAMLINALLVSAWNAAMPYSIKDVFCHSLIAYYLLLLMARHSQDKYKKLWARYFLPKTTLKNSCFVAIHAVLSCLVWPSDLPWRPRARNETCAETHFGEIKSHFRGDPSIEDCVLGTYHTHFKQYRQSAAVRAHGTKGKKVQALSPEEASDLATMCLKQACCFMSWICIDKDGWIRLGLVDSIGMGWGSGHSI